MKDLFAASIKLQQQMLDAQQTALDAQKASLEAGRKVMGANEGLATMQEVGQKMAQTNLDAMIAWTRMWSAWM